MIIGKAIVVRMDPKTLRVLMADGQWLMVNLGTTDNTEQTESLADFGQF